MSGDLLYHTESLSRESVWPKACLTDQGTYPPEMGRVGYSSRFHDTGNSTFPH